MKKILSFLMLLVSLQSVSAQGDEFVYDLILRLPLILIIFALVIFVSLYLKDHYAKLLGLFKRKKRKKEAEEKKVNYPFEIEKIKKSLPRLSPEEGFNQLSNLVKTFFKELLKLDYEFTYDELADELSRKRYSNDLISFSKELAKLRYSGGLISKDDLRGVIEAFSSLLKYIKGEEKPEKKGLVAKFLSSLEETEREQELRGLIQQERRLLKKNMKGAKKHYSDMLAAYSYLPKTSRKRIHPHLMGLYTDVNEALFSSVYSQKSKEELKYFSQKLSELKDKEFVSVFGKLASLLSKKAKDVREKVEEKPEKKVKGKPGKKEVEKKEAKSLKQIFSDFVKAKKEELGVRKREGFEKERLRLDGSKVKAEEVVKLEAKRKLTKEEAERIKQEAREEAKGRKEKSERIKQEAREEAKVRKEEAERIKQEAREESEKEKQRDRAGSRQKKQEDRKKKLELLLEKQKEKEEERERIKKIRADEKKNALIEKQRLEDLEIQKRIREKNKREQERRQRKLDILARKRELQLKKEREKERSRLEKLKSRRLKEELKRRSEIERGNIRGKEILRDSIRLKI